MAVKIRLQRGGARHAPHYRLVVADSRARRDGRFVEIIGTYDPANKVASRQVNIKLDRAAYWLGVGAQPSHTVRSLLKRARAAAPTVEEPVVAAVTPVEPAADVVDGATPDRPAPSEPTDPAAQ
jgi:small subunit ribosomal protein S16